MMLLLQGQGCIWFRKTFEEWRKILEPEYSRTIITLYVLIWSLHEQDQRLSWTI